MKAGSKKTMLSLVSAVIVCGGLRAAGSGTVIAALKGAEVILADRAGGSVTRLTGDPRSKWALRWLPDGQRISYLVPGENADKEFAKFLMERWPRLVISDLTGQVTREIPLRPADNSSNPDSIRAIEKVEWLSNRLVRFEGSFGPRNCASFDLDLDTGKTFSERDGECSSFNVSPDGRHIAYREPVSMGTWDDRAHRVDIEDTAVSSARPQRSPIPPERASSEQAAVSYAGTSKAGIHLEAGPVWSEDSQWVAIVERQIDSDRIAVTTLSIRGQVVTVQVPSDMRDDPTLTWIGDRVALGSGRSALVVDTARRAYLPLDSDTSAILKEATRTRQRISDDQQGIEDALKRLGAREGVARPN
ncbi:MAG: hypothetical protein ABSB88_18980 [Bryobacteraceae bacterium]|jgi:hypothetical protein